MNLLRGLPAWGHRALLHLGQVHAAGGCLCHLLRRTLHADALSAIFLGEKVGWRRWTAIVIGFLGAMIVIRPSWELFGLDGADAGLPAPSSSRSISFSTAPSRRRRSAACHADLGGFGGTITAGIILMIGHGLGAEDFRPELPDGGFELLILSALGMMSGYGHLLVVRAPSGLHRSRLLAPFQYFEIISATILGLVLFGDFPDVTKWTGIAIIVGSGLYIIWRERRNSDKKVAGEPA